MRLPHPHKSRVVLLGSGSYADERLPDVPAVRDNLADLAAVFTDPDHGIVAADGCVQILDESDLSRLGATLRSVFREAEDSLIVYYCGHGLTAGRRHDLYLALPGTDAEDPLFNALEYDKLRSAILDSPAKTKIVILDCCFSARAFAQTLSDVTSVADMLDVDGTYVLVSADREQVALAPEGERHTAFTGRLLRLLTDGVPEGPELLTLDFLYGQLRTIMRGAGLPEPQRFGTSTAEQFTLGRNRALSAEPVLLERQAEAIALAESGDWTKAAGLLRAILDDQRRFLGDTDEATLRTRQYIAHGRGHAGDPRGAAEDLDRLLIEQSHTLPADHDDVLRTRQYLAVNLGEAGDRHRAIALLRVLLPDRRRVLGHQHPDTLRTCHMLARNLTLTGARDEAAALLRELLEAREHLLGGDHPLTTRTRRDLDALSN
ncbi:caspase family protein [Actinomadura violacea]|uniref:Tetratricopeptide repeat protein n=1 Tax=Actinomadura violacea TaxID=2819934 RepID=A0ABS3RQU1_9ACTN|nr:tetratricopeptide repeat protein [Actinomadura violacea]MBO2459112.1 tetratricopeptide repeat protein [Actinomadura violacea]